jgi:hypothetical protein
VSEHIDMPQMKNQCTYTCWAEKKKKKKKKKKRNGNVGVDRLQPTIVATEDKVRRIPIEWSRIIQFQFRFGKQKRASAKTFHVRISIDLNVPWIETREDAIPSFFFFFFFVIDASFQIMQQRKKTKTKIRKIKKKPLV